MLFQNKISLNKFSSFIIINRYYIIMKVVIILIYFPILSDGIIRWRKLCTIL